MEPLPDIDVPAADARERTRLGLDVPEAVRLVPREADTGPRRDRLADCTPRRSESSLPPRVCPGQLLDVRFRCQEMESGVETLRVSSLALLLFAIYGSYLAAGTVWAPHDVKALRLHQQQEQDDLDRLARLLGSAPAGSDASGGSDAGAPSLIVGRLGGR